MSEEIEWTVPEGTRKQRIDKLLTGAFDEYSRSDFHRAFDAGLVLLDGKSAPKNKRVSEGMRIRFSMPEIEKCEMSPIDLDLDVVFEDEHIVVVNKRPGLITHPGAGSSEPTLAHGLLHHCKGQLSGIGGVERPGIIHRLDRETSGLIAAAKSDKAHRAMSELFSSRSIIKEYLALVIRVPEMLSGSIKKPIGRHHLHRHKMTVAREGEGREAHTDWKLEAKFEENNYALVRCRIHTGRTHQIRVHLSSVKHPILGDSTYGFQKTDRLPYPPERVMLHSARLAFEHPLTGEAMDLEAKVPEDFGRYVV